MTITSETAGDLGAAAGKGGKKKLLIIGAAVLGLVVVAGGGAAFLLGNGGGESEIAAVPEPHFFPLDTVTVNLNSESGRAEYLQLDITLEVSDAAMIDIIAPRLPRVMDAFQIYLRELRRDDLEGSAGVYRLKEELLRRINIAVQPAVVDDILFQNLLVQ